ncbi:MAG: TetR/AcrR family transcriptional regulator [Tissierellia bacterium]|nr:TetR/AcrR family transcriptional regulator [Tissierellia bacterium]
MSECIRKVFHKDTFEKISDKKREKIFQVAITEFAANGYSGTNINTIAKNADISIGSMYNYFESKEDLFLSIVDYGYGILEKALDEVITEDGTIFEIIERLFRITSAYTKSHKELNQIYLDLSTQGLSNLSKRLSCKMETITNELYSKILKNAKEKKEIRADVNEKLIAFYIDNLLVMYQFSLTSNYYKERMEIFLGEEICKDNEKIIMAMVDYIRKALS